MIKSTHYDIIIAGAGCAGLSLLMRLLDSGKFNDKKILLIDKDKKITNDRTWCYWEKDTGYFDKLVYKKWNQITFLSKEYSATSPIIPYQYKMIRAIDFYQYCFAEISKYPNIEICYGVLGDWQVTPVTVSFRLNGNFYQFPNIGYTQFFNSIYQPNSSKGAIRLLQHFKGWVIETNEECFDDDIATMMDFRVGQEHGTTFGYVLPISKTKALVEYTIFSKELLQQEQYDIELKRYIEHTLGIMQYSIIEEEKGVIPMTNEAFQFGSNNVWNIGTAGGQTKASSGYTFQFIQKQSDQVAEFLAEGKKLDQLPLQSRRFRFYDNTLLHILYHNQMPGKDIFTRLFKKNKPQQVLGFLDNETSLLEELKLISSLPALPFLKAAVRQI